MRWTPCWSRCPASCRPSETGRRKASRQEPYAGSKCTLARRSVPARPGYHRRTATNWAIYLIPASFTGQVRYSGRQISRHFELYPKQWLWGDDRLRRSDALILTRWARVSFLSGNKRTFIKARLFGFHPVFPYMRVRPGHCAAFRAGIARDLAERTRLKERWHCLCPHLRECESDRRGTMEVQDSCLVFLLKSMVCGIGI